MLSEPVAFAYEEAWRFTTDERIVIPGNITPLVLDMIVEILRNHGKVALVAANPSKISASLFTADLLNARR